MIPDLRTAAAIACAAIALPSTAQEWRIELSNPTLTPAAPSTDITISVYVTGEDYFHHAELATHATEPGWEEISFESLITYPGQARGELSPDGRSVVGQTFHRLYAFPPFPGPEPNPLPAWRGTFTATDFSPREITITTETGLFEVFVPTFPGFPPDIQRRTPLEAHAVIHVIPAPAPLALLTAGTLLTGRRRRPTVTAGRQRSGQVIPDLRTAADGYLDETSSAREPLPLSAEARAIVQVVPAPAPLALLGLEVSPRQGVAADACRRKRQSHAAPSADAAAAA